MATKNSNVIPFRTSFSSYDAVDEREKNIIGKRISEGRKRIGMTQRAFKVHLEKFGVTVSNTAESKWETGETVPNAYQLLAIWKALGVDDLPNYFSENSDSLLNDEGERKVLDYRSDLVATGRYQRKKEERFIEMMISTLAASAGTGSFLDDDRFEKQLFRESEVPQGADFGVRVSGDSMEPMFHDDDIAWVKRCEKLETGDIGIFTVDGEGFIKRYDEQEPDQSIREEYLNSYGELRLQPVLISLNEKYPPRVISPASYFHIAGRVLNTDR